MLVLVSIDMDLALDCIIDLNAAALPSPQDTIKVERVHAAPAGPCLRAEPGNTPRSSSIPIRQPRKQGKRRKQTKGKQRKQSRNHSGRMAVLKHPAGLPQQESLEQYYAIAKDDGLGSYMLDKLSHGTPNAAVKRNMMMRVLKLEARSLPAQPLRDTIQAHPKPFIDFLCAHYDLVMQYNSTFEAGARDAAGELWRDWPVALKLFAVVTGHMLAKHIRNSVGHSQRRAAAMSVASVLATAQRRWASAYNKQGERQKCQQAT